MANKTKKDVKELYVDEICKLLFLLKTEFAKDERERQESKSKIIVIKKGVNKQ